MTAEKPASPRIFRVQLSGVIKRDDRGRFRRSSTVGYTKVPYSGLFGLADTLVRAMTTGQLRRFTISVAHRGEITPEIRAGLVRWDQLLEATSEVVGVRWAQ